MTAPDDRASPFTLPIPAIKFNGIETEPTPARSMTVGNLIHNLIVFADLYEWASAEIDQAEPHLKPRALGERDANVDSMQRTFRATVGIDRVRSYVLATYGADLTIGTARRLLGDLIRVCGLSVAEAEALSLETAMDQLGAAVVPPNQSEAASAVTPAPPASADRDQGGAERGEGGIPQADPHADLRQFARGNLKGQERAVIEAVCDAGGELPIADLAVKKGVGWDDPFQGFKDAQQRLNKKLKSINWRLRRRSNAAFLEAGQERKRS